MGVAPVSPVRLAVLLLGAVALVAAAFAPVGDAAGARRLPAALETAAVGLVAVTLASGSRFGIVLPPADRVVWFLAVVAIVVTARLLRTGRFHPPTFLAVAAGAVVLVLVGVALIRAAAPAIDVYRLHVAAAEALRSGENPFVHVRVVETLPWGPGELIYGYTYPPLTMLLFAGAGILGDPRMAGVAGVVAGYLLLAFPLRRTRRDAALALAAAGVFLAQAAWIGIVYESWTEAVTLPFLLAAGRWWERRPVVAGILFGLGLATKQYFVLALPLLLVGGDRAARRRSLAALAAAAAVTVPWVVAAPGAFVEATVVHHLTRTPRPDALTLAGAGVVLPGWVAVAAALLVAVVLARRVRSGGDLLMAIAAVLAVFTLLAVRGFANTWWLVAALALATLLWSPVVTSPGDPPGGEVEGVTAGDHGGVVPPPAMQPARSSTR